MSQTQFMKDAQRKGGCIAYLIIFGIIISFIINVYFGILVLFMSIIFTIYSINDNKRKKIKEKEEFDKKMKLRYKQEEEYMINNGIIKNGVTLPWHYCRYLGGHPLIDKSTNVLGKKCYTWLDKDYLYLCSYFDKEFDEKNEIEKTSIPIKNILYYHLYGEVYNKTIIEGGGGGGTSIGGAIIGGLIAGEAGAIIGSRKEVDPITTRNEIIDKRKIIVEFYYNSKLSRMVLGQWDLTYELLFLKELPEKEMNFVINNKKEINNSSNEVLEQIEKIAELKEKGILTEDEFNEKKRVILDKIK